jgi:hypothetical protein
VFVEKDNTLGGCLMLFESTIIDLQGGSVNQLLTPLGNALFQANFIADMLSISKETLSEQS